MRVSSKAELKAQIREAISKNPKATIKALMLLYQAQTLEEQQIAETVESNKIGFNSCDAKYLTKIAQLVENGVTLYPGTVVKLQQKLPKYWKQFLNIALDKRAKKNEKTVKDLEIESFATSAQ